jgi:hypothetical protein
LFSRLRGEACEAVITYVAIDRGSTRGRIWVGGDDED